MVIKQSTLTLAPSRLFFMPLNLSHDDLLIILQQVDIPPSDKIIINTSEILSGGVLNQNIKVSTNAGTFVVKIFNAAQLDPNATASHEEIYKLHAYLAENTRYMPAPRGFLKQYQGYDIFVMDFIEGQTPKIDMQFMFDFGKTLANFHNHLSMQPDFKKKPNDILSFLTEVGSSLWRAVTKMQFRAEATYLGILFQYALSTLRYPNFNNLPSGINHGDIHLGNLLLDQRDQLIILDLELGFVGPYLKDIANALCMLCFSNKHDPNAFNTELAQYFLSGYSFERPLLPLEINQLGIFLKDRAWLERAGNQKLINEGRAAGSPFTLAHFQAIHALTAPTAWAEFSRNALKNLGLSHDEKNPSPVDTTRKCMRFTDLRVKMRYLRDESPEKLSPGDSELKQQHRSYK
jgi:Ser/Thr protein kinase RdoA (MazF antagonist)